MSIQDLYRSAIIEHNKNPRNFHELDDATHQSRGLNALCGDDIRVYLRVAGDRIDAASFIGQASAITIASASLMTQMVINTSLEQALAAADCLDQLLSATEVSDKLRERAGELTALEGVRQSPSRIKSARLPWQTLRAALDRQTVASTE